MGETPAVQEGSARRPELITLAVPEDLYEDVIDFIAERRRAERSKDAANGGELATEAKPNAVDDPAASAIKQSADGLNADWDKDSLRGLLEQANEKLVTALIAVARSPQWSMRTDEITQAAGLKPGRSWGGFISRAQTSSRHRWGRDLPLEWRDWDLGRNQYALRAEDAVVIQQWAEEHSR
jgi:hypothetical protein